MSTNIINPITLKMYRWKPLCFFCLVAKNMLSYLFRIILSNQHFLSLYVAKKALLGYKFDLFPFYLKMVLDIDISSLVFKQLYSRTKIQNCWQSWISCCSQFALPEYVSSKDIFTEYCSNKVFPKKRQIMKQKLIIKYRCSAQKKK